MIYAILVLNILVNAYNINIQPHEWGSIVNTDIDLVNGWFNVEPCNKQMFATEKVNIRVSPKVGTTKVGFLKFNEEIHVIGICDNNWSQVDYNGITAYINSDYLSDNKTVIESDRKKEVPTEEPSETVAEEPKKTYPSFVEVVGVSDSVVDSVLANYYRIPEIARTKFEDFGGVLSITNENLGAKFYNNPDMHIVAVTDYHGSKGTCSINISPRDTAAVLHEMGHFIDYVCGGITSTEEYKNIWGSEVEAFKSFHSTADANTNSVNEYFAESFEVYIESPEELKSHCPQSYNYIVNILGKI